MLPLLSQECSLSTGQAGPSYVGPSHWPLSLSLPGDHFLLSRPCLYSCTVCRVHWVSGWWYVDWSHRRLVLNIHVLFKGAMHCSVRGQHTKQSHWARLGIAGGINNAFPGCSCDQNDFLWQLGIMIDDLSLSCHYPSLSLVRCHIPGLSLVERGATGWNCAVQRERETIECCMQTQSGMNNDL